jgi:hypothetical protein
VTIGKTQACLYDSKPGKKKGEVLIKCGKVCDPGEKYCPHHIMIAEWKEAQKNARIDGKLAQKRAAVEKFMGAR